MLDSLVRVSRRVVYDHYASVRAEARSSVRAGRMAPSAIRRPERRYIPRAFDRPPKPTLARPRGSTPARKPAEPRRRVWSQTLPFQQFHCFSSFDHSTCALSVSGQYLALDEIYHPFRAAFPNNSTRRRSFTWARAPHPIRDSHPL
ncbi:hypothetical protein N7540_003512 [Penicillium herquei]|nr:hypothetical protein N7540_003512 [Penicillium herquei]